MIKLGSQLNRRKGKSARSRRISAILAMAMLFVTTSAIFVDSNNVSIIPGFDNASKVYARTLSDEGKDYEDANKTAEANKNTADQLVEDIKEVNDEIAEQAKLIESSNQAIAQLDKEIELSEKDIAEVEDEISEKRQALGAVLSTIYESTEAQDDFSVLLRAEDMYDLLGRDEYVTDITNYIEDKIDDLELAEEEKYDKNDDLLRLRDDRQTQLEEYEAEQAELGEYIGKLSSLMEEAKEKAESAEALAEELRVKVQELEAAENEVLSNRTYNGESSGVVYDGDGTDYYYVDAYNYTDEELTLLAGIIEAEAGSVSYPGMVAVGSVVMNRVASPNFSNTIEGVIYSPYQFEPVSIGTYAVILARGPAESCYQAAQDVLNGKRNVPNYYFKAAWYAEEHGISGVNIGGNVFH